MKYKLKNVSKIFESNKGKFTLNNISLSIKPNAINVIYGKSGSGKTTLLNILSSLDIEYNGSVTLENTSIKDLTEEERAELRLKKIGLVYQFFNLLPDLTIYENILLPNVILGKNNKEKCNELIEYLNLNTIINQLPVQCSGGELQRASFARALINNPEIIIADEPTGNLDSKNTENIIKLISKLHEKFKTTFIIATHDDEFKKITPNVYELKDGKLVSKNEH